MYTTSYITVSAIADLTSSLDKMQGVCVTSSSFRDWSSLDAVYTKLIGIQKYQLFSFTSTRKGEIGCQVEPNDIVKWTRLHKSEVSVSSDLVIPQSEFKGLSNLKKNDMFFKIRPFVPDEYKDALCPKPSEFIIESVGKSKIHEAIDLCECEKEDQKAKQWNVTISITFHT